MTVKVQRRDCSSGADPKPCGRRWNNLPLTILICSIEHSVVHMLIIPSRPITHTAEALVSNHAADDANMRMVVKARDL